MDDHQRPVAEPSGQKVNSTTAGILRSIRERLVPLRLRKVVQAAALDAISLLRDPFRVVGIPEWSPTVPDRTRG